MKVYKFGGGVLQDAESIRQMTSIIREETNLIIVVSAFSKITNAFELLLQQLGRDASKQLKEIEAYHYRLVLDLFSNPEMIWRERINPLFERVIEVLGEIADESYDRAYDQLVVFGEYLSSAIISAYWIEVDINHQIWDARDVIITDSNYRSANVDWKLTSGRKNDIDGELVLTQGFIGGTVDGSNTTLGREGSDYTAAILGNIYSASEVVIWKDVPGVLTADPQQFADTEKMDEISYLEAVELSYFGAKVIHPNTIKPLQNKAIPLIVKSLYFPDSSGTLITSTPKKLHNRPVYIRKENQVLVSIQPRDFSFIVEDAMARVFTVLSKNGVRVNLMQHGAISISIVFDWSQGRLDSIVGELLPEFKVLYNTGLELWTVRHYTDQSIERIIEGKRIYVQQKSRKTARFVVG